MQIGSAAGAYTTLFDSLRTRGARNAGATMADAAAPASAPKGGATGASGSLSGLLSYMTNHAVRQGDAGKPAQDGANVSDADREFLHRIATDEKFARQQAEVLGTSYDWENVPAGTWTLDPSKTLGNADNPAIKVQSERLDYYETMLKDGLPPAQIYANLLAFNANLDQSYGDSLDHTGTVKPGTYNAVNRAKMEALQQAMAGESGNGASAAASPVQSWARDLNDNDRQMLEAMTGYTVAEDGAFVDGDGNKTMVSPSYAAVIAAISLSRADQGANTVPLNDAITPEQYSQICDRVQVAMFQAGDLFDQSVRTDGLSFLKNAADGLKLPPPASPREGGTYIPRWPRKIAIAL